MILFVNACVRKNSRTKRIAERFIEKRGISVQEVYLPALSFPAADEAFLAKRDALLAAGAVSDRLFDCARQFAAADEIIIAAPYWDLSFPAALKQYFEQINVCGITFRYTEKGSVQGLCRAKRLTYITTAGGTFVPDDYGFGYTEALARGFWGIKEVKLIKAAGLDIAGADTEAILGSVEKNMI